MRLTAISDAVGRIVRCPGCGGRTRYEPANRWRPFCSARCRGTDLGAWADEDYRVPVRPHDDPAAPDDDLISADREPRRD